MSSQCLAHASPIYAARMNDPPVAAVGTGNQGTSELSQALGSTSSGDAGNGAAGETTDFFWPGQQRMSVCVWEGLKSDLTRDSSELM